MKLLKMSIITTALLMLVGQGAFATNQTYRCVPSENANTKPFCVSGSNQVYASIAVQNKFITSQNIACVGPDHFKIEGSNFMISFIYVCYKTKIVTVQCTLTDKPCN